jgi:hypothetical protein
MGNKRKLEGPLVPGNGRGKNAMSYTKESESGLKGKEDKRGSERLLQRVNNGSCSSTDDWVYSPHVNSHFGCLPTES